MLDISEDVEESVPFCDMGSLVKLYFNPVIIMGKKGKRKLDDNVEVVVVGSGKYRGDNTKDFVDSASKRIVYFSYRNCFSKLPNGETTDCHWGCLIRSGQMLMCQALMRCHGGVDSVIPGDQFESLRDKVLPLFMDTPSAPFSIHRIEDEVHTRQDIPYSAMLTPTQACKAFANACKRYHESGERAPYPICSPERHVVKSKVHDALRDGDTVLLMFPVVMGLSTLNSMYAKVFLRCLDMESSCGIAGGYRKASFYFYGHQGKHVFYQNPHYVQTAYRSPSSAGKTSFARSTTTTSKIDTCMFLGFHIKDEKGFERFMEELADVNSLLPFPLISSSMTPEGYLQNKSNDATVVLLGSDEDSSDLPHRA